MNLNQLFDLSFIGRRDEPALEFQGVSSTFGEIDARSNRLAQLLIARGIGRGERLCCYLVNSPFLIDLYLACVKTGVIFTPINILYREREIAHILADASPLAVVSDRPMEAKIPVWTPEEMMAAAGSQPDTRPENVRLDGDSPAGIIYTSGTTGTSKGAVLTHNNFAINAINIAACWRIDAADRLLLALPLFHVHALGNGLHAWLLTGCRLRLLERFDHEKAAEEFLSFRTTLFFGVPAMYVRMNDWAQETAAAVGRDVRLFVSGSAPLPVQTLEEFRRKYGHTILERYGMSETLMNLSNPYEGERRPGSVGMPLPGISARILDEQGLGEVRDGETGELYLKGPNVFAGYWGREEATRAAFRDGGWFRTGDLAMRQADGYYTLSGRRSDLIISGGFNIYPREIEEFLEELDGVIEAAVIGVADRVRGEVPVAYIVGDAEAGPLEDACRQKLASFKVPRAFTRVEKLPRNALGKVQKHLLPRGS
ncbi:MAG TPA: AMP-binding protein [Bryobacteraceae bacterium]|jgi:malonyl-CoA/methylmalonyl-CoA synthetase